MMNFKSRPLKRLYEKGDKRGLPADMVGKIETILAALDSAQMLNDLDRPSFKLHPLKGDRDGQWSITVRSNWRIVFGFDEVTGEAFDVDFIDYH